MKRFALFSALLMFAVACSEDDDNQDTTTPNILSVQMNGEDHDLSFSAGSSIQVSAELSDNEELGELKIDIHDLFDGHDHGKMALSTWETTQVIALSGSNTTANSTLIVPDSTLAGPYHAILQLLDAAGNEAEFKEIEFILTNGQEPQIQIEEPNFDTLNISPGSSISLVGSVSDDTDLQEISLLIYEDADHSHKNQADVIFDFDEDLPGSNDVTYDLNQININIPSATLIGHYKFVLKAKDNTGNYGVFEAEIDID